MKQSICILCAAGAIVGCSSSSDKAVSLEGPPPVAAGISDDPDPQGPFQVPRGFVVEVAAPPDQTGSLVQLTFDSLGRPVVSKERDHPRTLFDSDGDGVFETEKIFSDKVKNLQGMWFDGRALYAIGNDSENEQAGLYKLEDTDGDDVADTFETLNIFTGPMGEHGPHDIRRSPDGHPTVLLGNHTFVPGDLIAPNSPLAGYQESQLLERYMDARGHAVGIMAPGGALFRLNREKQQYTLLFGGFRNPYNHAYNWEGEAFTFDSDMEWDINLPWYREVRSVHGVPGADYGWRTGSGKFPAYYLDSLPPVDDLGRGSPVGVEFYHHYAYPKEYFGTFLQGDWSRGRIVLSKFARNGATYKTSGATFDFVYGEPLNVTDAEVGPDGFVYFTMGGRNTQGGLFRVAYRGRHGNQPAQHWTGAMAAVKQPQPLSSWGHAALLKLKEEMGDAWGADLEKIARNPAAESYDRVQALMLLQRYTPRPNADLLRPLSKDADPYIRAAAIYVVGQHGSDRAKAIAAGGLKDADPFVRRRAAEALVRLGLDPGQPAFAPIEDIYALLNDSDRFVRYAGRLALERTPRSEWAAKVLEEKNPLGAIEGLVALNRTARSETDLEAALAKELSLLKTELPVEDQLRLLRAHNLTCIGFAEGCRPAVRKQVSDILLSRFPSADERLNRELARTLAYCGQPEAIEKILAAMPAGDDNQQLQIHYAYCLRAVPQGWTKEQKKQLLSWFGKARDWRGGASFPGFLNLIFDSSLAFFDANERRQAYAAIPEYAPADPNDPELRHRGNFTRAQVFARKRGVEALSAQEVFEYMMYDPMTTLAKTEDGEAIFKETCEKCHRFGDRGKDYGPDLTTINNRFKRRDLVEAVLWPSKVISDQYEAYVVDTKDNESYLGMIASEDERTLVLNVPEEERPLVLKKSEIKEKRISKVSTMPDGLLDPYSTGEIAALFKYIQEGASGKQGNSE